MPFGELVSQGSQKRYTAIWVGLISFLIQCADLKESKCRFGLSAKQQNQLAVYVALLNNPDADLNKAVEALTFLSASLFCHAFGKDTDSDHPLIAYTILSSTRPGNVIANPVNISPFLAAIEYFCRTTIMVYSHIVNLNDPRKVTFYDAARKLSVWLKEGENTAFAWIRQMLHLTARFIYGSNQMPRFIWGIDEGRSYTFDGYRIQLSNFVAMVRGSVQEAVSGFIELWQSYGIPTSLLLTSLDGIGDALAVRSTHYNFTRHPTNVSLRMRIAECRKAAINSGIFCQVVDGRFLWHTTTITAALNKSRKFLQLLAVAIYLSSGQPP